MEIRIFKTEEEIGAACGQLFCDMDETTELRYFSLDDDVDMFSRQHRELFNDLKELRNTKL